MRTRLIAAFIITVLIPLIGTSLYGNWVTSRVLQARAVEAAQADLRLRRLQMEDALRGVEQDLLFLSQMDSLTALINGRSPDTLTRTQIDLADFVATHPDVFQARYLDKTGQEVVRIDAGANGIVPIPPDQLQNKADRYYFTETMALPLGAVFVSPIDLNREFGQIQEPRTPTLRYATPVFTNEGSRAGIVILNLYAVPLLQYAEGDTLALLDASGYFLTHPNPAFTWGGPADLNSGINGRTVYPEVWQAIPPTDRGIVLPEPQNGWQAAWEFLSPFVAQDDARRALVYETVTGGANSWRLVNDLPRATLFASVGDFRITAILIIIWAMLLAAGMAVLFARQLARPIQLLTAEVRQFGQKHSPVQRQQPVHHVPARYEVDELHDAFHEMAAALETQLTQLTQLNLAGHHITARLEQADLLTAVATALHRLFPIEYLVLSLENRLLHTDGDAAWASYRHAGLLDGLIDQAMSQGNWTTMSLVEAGLPTGYLCCAPLCVEGRLGLVELYGRDATLGRSTTGELLATLAVQISIAQENAELVKRLARRRAELQTLLAQLLTAQEEERRRIAYDIHDGLIQMLVGIRLQLNNFAAENGAQSEQAAPALQKGMDELAAAIVEARRVIEGLRPAELDDLGLATAVRHLAETVCAETGSVLHLIVDLPDDRLPSAVETTAFRILQEALSNVRKYAAPANLRISLVQTDATFEGTVADDGPGFDINLVTVSPDGGFGLRSMQERAALLGGHCQIESNFARGTTVHLTLPINGDS